MAVSAVPLPPALSIACDPVTALLSCWCVCDLSEICGGLGENFFMKQYDMPHFFSQFVWSPSPVLILECQPSKVWKRDYGALVSGCAVVT